VLRAQDTTRVSLLLMEPADLAVALPARGSTGARDRNAISTTATASSWFRR
jgi:hypothetical protein